MSKKTRFVVYAAVLAALYVVLTHLQNLVIPGSATWAIQFRASEALCVMALFTPAAVPGLTVGCFLFNITYAQALPLDVLVGWELSVYIGGGFAINALYVAIGELAVLLTLGSLLYTAIRRRGLDKRVFK